jgi:hypothetical protein
MFFPLLIAGALGSSPADLETLARQNASVLRISTLICADQVNRYLKDDAGISRAIDWSRQHGITHVYLESYRDGVTPARETLSHARDRFRQAGFLVSGCVTTTRFGKRSTGWDGIACYTDERTQRELKAIFTYAASLFDEIMIDDFLFCDCACAECRAAKGSRSWSDYRRDLMLRCSREDVLGAARSVNPKVRVIIKYPCWHEDFQERGYDVDRQTRAFDMTWVGTETRGGVPKSGWTAEPQYRAYWLMRWLLGIGGAKCGGGWYDWLGTSPEFYLEQGRQTVLGGAREVMLFNFGALYDDNLGKRDVAALAEEMPQHFRLARLIRGKTPRGLLGWKPPNSPAGSDRNLHSLLGMAGFPVTAAHVFDAKAPGFVFGHQALQSAEWKEVLRTALRSGRTILVTPDFLRAVSSDGARDIPLAEVQARAFVLPPLPDPNRWQAVEDMPEAELNALRDRALRSLGASFHAPARVALYLFGNDVAVVENFRDEPVRCSLLLEGWRSYIPAVQMPAKEPVKVSGNSRADFLLPPRALLALRRARTR